MAVRRAERRVKVRRRRADAAASEQAAAKPPGPGSALRRTRAGEAAAVVGEEAVEGRRRSDIGPALTLEMVDRLFWRAGFGPSQNDRTTWTGKPSARLSTGCSTRPREPPSAAGDVEQPADRPPRRRHRSRPRLGRPDGLRSNPLVERLTFFWHRHWACSLDSVDLLFMARQNDLFRRYSDLGANPTADFRNLAYEVSEDPAMLGYLNGELNRRVVRTRIARAS